MLSEKPAITTTIASLPPALLEQLLGELSTLASVYHKPPESFVGKGRFGADEIQQAAIQEQRQNAADDPIAASAATTAADGPAQNNIENLLDIDFDGAAPASAAPAAAAPAGSGSGMDDMMGLFDAPAAAPVQAAGSGAGAVGDMMNGFGGLELGAGAGAQGSSAAMPPAQGQGAPAQKKTSEDLLGLF